MPDRESIADLKELSEESVNANPIIQFNEWYERALNANLILPNAMTLATATPDGIPSARMVLLKDFDERGFVFYTNYESQKARELDANPNAALVFYWAELDRQVRISGTTSRVTREESESYFRTRPEGSRYGAWASRQSEVISSREVLEERVREFEAKFKGKDIPLPPYWGGYRLEPRVIEFWQNRANRLHDRLRYRLAGGNWLIERLSP